MKVEHDVAHDAAYFAFSASPAVRQERLGNGRIVDVGADGSVVGVEFISPSRGLDLVGVPRAAEIARAARRRGMRVLPASDVARAG
jgi:uncharacterized protein YuzE